MDPQRRPTSMTFAVDDTTKTWPPSPARKDTHLVYRDNGAEVKLTMEANGPKDGPTLTDEKGALAHPANYNRFTANIHKVQLCVHGFLSSHIRLLKRSVLCLALIAYAIYLMFVVLLGGRDAIALVSVTALVVAGVAFTVAKRRFGTTIKAVIAPQINRLCSSRLWFWFKWTLFVVLVFGLMVFLGIDISEDLKPLTSACGMVVIVCLAFVTSKNPSRVKWRPVIWGMALQFLLGVLILRWQPGFLFFNFLGKQVKAFLDFADEGSKFVFGEHYEMHPMAFKVFPIVIYFSAVINILYHWGLMQLIVCKIAWLMQFTMGTTAIESLNAATNIFIGMAESCVVLRPFVYRLTLSELHAVMTGGFATVAGSYIALLIEVGASAEHLLSAAIMSAPAALALAKLSYPETEVSNTKTEEDVYIEKTPARNVMEAASNGAMAAVKVVAAVAANLIAILGLIAFLNAIISYLGSQVGYPQLSFQLICSYVFWPLAVIMGVQIEDANKVGSLLGTKVFVDEFVSFRDLNVMVQSQQIATRSRVIATYACCGFGSIAAVGIYVGALISVAPDRRGDIAAVALRAVVNGNLASFLTACIAGILYKDAELTHPISPTSNVTSSVYDFISSATTQLP